MNEPNETTDPAEVPEVKASRSHKAKKPEDGGQRPEARDQKPEKTVPPCPDADPMAGDKTPAVVAWWFKHHPEEAELRYANRKGVARP